MIYLILVSFVWAFSFGLIKTQLTGLDPSFISCCRMLLSFALFLPFLRLRRVSSTLALQLAVIGAIQYGFMYITYISSFHFLKAYQIALFTIFTPLYVTLINDAIQKRFTALFLFSALLAIVGTAVIVFRDIHQVEFRTGFLLVQASNICFAFGQILYRHVMAEKAELRDDQVFGLCYLGAVVVTGLSAGISTRWTVPELSTNHVLALLYLGVLASGVCFFLWNLGARKTNTGLLAVANNLKVPLAVACSMVFFHEKGNLPRLLIGGGIMVAAMVMNEWVLRRREERFRESAPL